MSDPNAAEYLIAVGAILGALATTLVALIAYSQLRALLKSSEDSRKAAEAGLVGIRQQIVELTRANEIREAISLGDRSPILSVEPNPSTQDGGPRGGFTVRNIGRASARDIAVRIFMVIFLRGFRIVYQDRGSEPVRAGMETFVEFALDREVGRWSYFDASTNPQIGMYESARATYLSDSNAGLLLTQAYFRVQCKDELGRLHERWFLGGREIPSVVDVPRGGASPPAGDAHPAEFLGSLVT